MIARDSYQKVADEDNSHNFRITLISMLVSYFSLIIVLAVLAGVHSQAAGISLILISIIPFCYILNTFGIIPFTFYKSHHKLLLVAYVTLAILCGVTGCVLNPKFAFYWSSFTWAAIGLLFLSYGLYFDFYGPERVYG